MHTSQTSLADAASEPSSIEVEAAAEDRRLPSGDGDLAPAAELASADERRPDERAEKEPAEKGPETEPENDPEREPEDRREE